MTDGNRLSFGAHECIQGSHALQLNKEVMNSQIVNPFKSQVEIRSNSHD